MRWAVSLFSGVVAATLAGCGGGGGNGADSCNPGPSASYTISSTGISPTNVCISPGGTVTFTNSDTASHHIEFETAGCPTGPDISGGSSATVTFAETQQNCSFHDGNNPSSAAFKGTVAVTNVTVSGGGY